jgi:hypothetical protein
MKIGQALLAALLASCGTSPPPQPFVGRLPAYNGGHFAIIGDTQRTTFLGLVLQNENNDPERQLLLPMLASRRPAFVVMVGDLVSFGSSDDDWSEFEDRSKSVREGRIPVLAVLGNHEYMLNRKSGLRHFFDRLPDLQGERWYDRTHGPLGMLFLDSNVEKLTDLERDAQLTWYRGALGRMQSDPNVLGILVFMHHAPFTNNSLVGDDDYAQLTFVPPFMNASKSMAMVTGHAHGYERFERGTKTFIVSGGGGGPRFPILTGDKRRHADEKYTVPGRRHFNFVELSFRQSSLHAVVVGLPKDKKDFCQMDEFDLRWPAAPLDQVATHVDDGASPATLPSCN